MGVMVYSFLRAMQDLYHQPYVCSVAMTIDRVMTMTVQRLQIVVRRGRLALVGLLVAAGCCFVRDVSSGEYCPHTVTVCNRATIGGRMYPYWDYTVGARATQHSSASALQKKRWNGALLLLFRV